MKKDCNINSWTYSYSKKMEVMPFFAYVDGDYDFE